MESVVHLDTHVALWMDAGLTTRIGSRARSLMRRASLRLSPMAMLEMDLLFELGRTGKGGAEVVASLGRKVGLDLDEAPFADVARAAAAHRWTRDPFDRLLVAQASLGTHALLTGDRAILEAYPEAVDIDL